MSEKSMLDLAYEVICETKQLPISFHELWEAVCIKAALTKEEMRNQISRFYTNISLDGRFVALTDNFWDLREHHTFDKVHIDMNDVYSDVEETEEIDEEEIEYLKIEKDEDKEELEEEAEETEDEEKVKIEDLY
ncbi:MAG TPA: DNA-directed RNA polymerase subunit delta [Bacilli bacterium]|jgi:DNA-directed RNA polymerase subunit delta|nr:DNA-directed RNA polymerase subunit delta [Bacilli bacterium]